MMLQYRNTGFRIWANGSGRPPKCKKGTDFTLESFRAAERHDQWPAVLEAFDQTGYRGCDIRILPPYPHFPEAAIIKPRTARPDAGDQWPLAASRSRQRDPTA